jgi:penicillin-binding protein 2
VIPVDPERQQDKHGAGRLFRDDTRFALGRIAVFQYATAAVFLYLIASFWILQVRDHEANAGLAERNRIKTVPVPAPRGKILDRDGRIIVDNHSSFTLMLTQEALDPAHLDPIARGLNLDLDDLKATVARYAKGPKYVPIPLKEELTLAEVTFVESHRDAAFFPELEIVEAQRRLYPQNGSAAHVLGYLGEVSEAELNTIEFAKYSQGDIVGKTGLERQYNNLLTGVDGERRVVVDALGRERQVLESKEATPGRNLQLTLDLDLQVVADIAMEGRRGAVVALDPRNGEVLAMVSRPGFDPNAFAGRLRQSDYDALIKNPYNPMLNRAIQGQYAPGSTFKPLVAVAGLETGLLEDDMTAFCDGGATIDGHYYRCHSKHGKVDLHTAIVESCDVFFYNLGNRLGIDNIARYAEAAGVGRRTGIDLPGEAEGLMPSTQWKRRMQREPWYPGETISVAIGQGAVTVTPLQLAVAIGGLVNGATWYRPHLVRESREPEDVRHGGILQANIDRVVAGMYGVVNEGGTGASAAIAGITVSGKTGSAQLISNELAKSNKALAETMQDNGWFVGFAPRDNPEIVVAVLVESGLHGTSSAPIARDVIKAYFDKKTRMSRMAPLDMALLRRMR